MSEFFVPGAGRFIDGVYFPPRPSGDHEWTGLEWVIPDPDAVTQEEISRQAAGSLRILLTYAPPKRIWEWGEVELNRTAHQGKKVLALEAVNLTINGQNEDPFDDDAECNLDADYAAITVLTTGFGELQAPDGNVIARYRRGVLRQGGGNAPWHFILNIF